MEEFHFIRPLWFLALIPLAVFTWKLSASGRVSRLWEHVVDTELLPHVLINRRVGKRLYMERLLALLAFIMIVALAGPTWERLPQPVYKNDSALVIALDLSLSMLADDIQPSRLERARFEISDLLDKRKEGQTALLVYAGDAFTVTPLTDDVKTIKSQLSALSPLIMPAPGSDPEKALSLARELLVQAGMPRGHILFITDEIEPDYKDAVVDARKAGYLTSVLGVGTVDGAPIQLETGGYVKSPDGRIIIPKLDIESLRAIAEAGGGLYQTSQFDDRDISRLSDLFDNIEDINGDQPESDMESDVWYEFGPWLLLPVLPLVALVFRRGILCLVAVLLVFQQEPVMAFEWSQLWLNSDQRAHKALQQEEAEKAAELFNDPDWKAVAKYRAGDFEAAEKIFSDGETVTSLYNKANALAKQGRYEEAIKAYDEVLQIDSEHEDAIYNKDLIEKEMQQNQQPAQQTDKQTDEGSDGDDPDSGGFEGDYNDQQSGSSGQSDEQGEGESPEGQDMSDQEGTGVKQTEEEEEQQQAQSKQDDEKQELEKKAEQTEEGELDEEQLAAEQWLRRIPDDPSGLLRRKFRYQYQQQSRQTTTDKYW